MRHITFLGLGAMGSRMVPHLLQAGHKVTVWNRNPLASKPLAELGAIAAPTPAQAVEGAHVVISMVRDDDASRYVWLDANDGALQALAKPTLAKKALAIECSTLSLGWVKTLAERCASKGISFMDAPVAGSRPQAEAGQLIFFVGGEQTHAQQAQPLFELMGSRATWLGNHGAGTMAKLATNALLALQVAGLAEILTMVKGFHGDTSAIMQNVLETPVGSPFAKLINTMMLNEQYAPLFPIELVNKDCQYIHQTGQAFGQTMPLMQAAQACFARAEQAGLGGLNMTALSKSY